MGLKSVVPSEYWALLASVVDAVTNERLYDEDKKRLLLFYQENDSPSRNFSKSTYEKINAIDEVELLKNYIDYQGVPPYKKVVIMGEFFFLIRDGETEEKFRYEFNFKKYGIKPDHGYPEVHIANIGQVITDKKIEVACDMFMEIFHVSLQELEREDDD